MTESDSGDVMRCAALAPDALASLFARYGLEVVTVPPGAPIPGSHWGAPEAGLVGNRLLIRGDTPVHSALHEGCHYVCMDRGRRARLHTDAGGSAIEECAVCFLSVLLADEVAGFGRERMLGDMDRWGYSFRLGGAAAWFARDADDARAWLAAHRLVDADGRPGRSVRE